MIPRILKLFGTRRQGNYHHRPAMLETGIGKARIQVTGRQTSESIFQITPRTTDPFQLPEYGVCPVGGNGVKNPYVPVVFRYVEILNNHVLQHIFPHDRSTRTYTVGVESCKGQPVVTVRVVDIVLYKQSQMGIVGNR